MSDYVRRFLSWLSAAMAVVLFLYYLLPEPKDNPYMNLYSSTHGDSFSGCEFSNGEKSAVIFRFAITPEECRFVIYKGRSSVWFSIDYPELKVVRDGGDGNKFPVSFYMERVSKDDFDADRHLRGKRPILVEGGIETYESGGIKERKFSGKDGVSVYVSDYVNTIRANRLYKSGLWVFYHYPKELADIESVDEFALDVLGKIVIE